MIVPDHLSDQRCLLDVISDCAVTAALRPCAHLSSFCAGPGRRRYSSARATPCATVLALLQESKGRLQLCDNCVPAVARALTDGKSPL